MATSFGAVSSEFRKTYIEGRLSQEFHGPTKLADAKYVLRLMKEAGGDGFSVSLALLILGFAGLAWFGMWPAALLLVYVGVLGRVMTASRRDEARAARKKIAALFEFDHVQYPYWKSVAWKLRTILKDAGEFKRRTLPSYVWEG